MNKIKMVVSDLDGTLLDGNHQLNEVTIDTIEKIQKMGIKFVVATGRNYYSLNEIVKKLKIDKYNGYVIGSNGQQLYDYTNSSYFQSSLISESDGFKIRQLCYKNRLNTIIFYDHKIYCNNNIILNIFIKSKFLLARINKSVSDKGFENYVNIKKKTIIKGDLNKICVLSSNTKRISKIKKELGSQFDVLCLNKFWYEIMPKDVNKGIILDRIMEKENLNKDEVMVFGDGENDIEMLKRVNASYAMKNAMPSIKHEANYIAEKNSDNGVVKILKEKLFILK